MPQDQIVVVIMTALVAFLIGLSKGGLGGTLGALATSLLALVMPADQVIGLLLPFLLVADLFAVAIHWRRWNSRIVLFMLPGAILGVTIGTFFITNAPTEVLRTTLGFLVLIFAIYRFLKNSLFKGWIFKARDRHGLVAGTISGFTSALAHTGGPPVDIYLLMLDLTPRMFVATSVLFFAILNWIKVPYYFYAGLFDLDLLLEVVWLMLLLPVGVWIGKWAVERVSKEIFEKVILGLLTFAALLLIFT